MSRDAHRSVQVQLGAGSGVENAHENRADNHQNDRNADDPANITENIRHFGLRFECALALLWRKLRHALLRRAALFNLLLHKGAPADALAENRCDSNVEHDENEHRHDPARLTRDILKRGARIEKRADDAAESADRLRRSWNSGSRCGHVALLEANGFAILHYA